MDCSLAFAALDLARRPYVKVNLKLRGKKVEDMPCENILHFLESLAMALRANVHVWVEYGSNDAVSVDPRRRGVPSSKGVI